MEASQDRRPPSRVSLGDAPCASALCDTLPSASALATLLTLWPAMPGAGLWLPESRAVQAGGQISLLLLEVAAGRCRYADSGLTSPSRDISGSALHSLRRLQSQLKANGRGLQPTDRWSPTDTEGSVAPGDGREAAWVFGPRSNQRLHPRRRARQARERLQLHCRFLPLLHFSEKSRPAFISCRSEISGVPRRVLWQLHSVMLSWHMPHS